MEIGKAVTMKLIYAPKSGVKKKGDGSEFDWHMYPVNVKGQGLFNLFTPNEDVHQALMAAGVTKKGVSFTITEGVAKNPKTHKKFSYYTVKCGDKTISSKDLPQKTSKPPESKPQTTKAPPKESPAPKEVSTVMRPAYDQLMVNMWDRAYKWITEGIQEPDLDNKYIQLRLAVIEKTSTILNTRIMQKDGYVPVAKHPSTNGGSRLTLGIKTAILRCLSSSVLSDEEREKIKARLDMENPGKITDKDLLGDAEGKRVLGFIMKREEVKETKDRLYRHFGGDEEEAIEFVLKTLNISKPVEIEKLSVDQLVVLRETVAKKS